MTKIVSSLLLMLVSVITIQAQNDIIMESKYDPHALFGTSFYATGGTISRAATGEPNVGYWQNKADYQINATLKQSIASFEKARALRPEFLLNYFEMAKAYKDNNNKAKAIAYLQLMITLPIQTEDDVTLKEKAKALIKEWE